MASDLGQNCLPVSLLCDAWHKFIYKLFSDLAKKLKEHRIEGTASVVMCLLGLIIGVVAFRTGNRWKWLTIVGMVAMLFSSKYQLNSDKVPLRINANYAFSDQSMQSMPEIGMTHRLIFLWKIRQIVQILIRRICLLRAKASQLAFFINLQRAVIGPSATLAGR